MFTLLANSMPLSPIFDHKRNEKTSVNLQPKPLALSSNSLHTNLQAEYYKYLVKQCDSVVATTIKISEMRSLTNAHTCLYQIRFTYFIYWELVMLGAIKMLLTSSLPASCWQPLKGWRGHGARMKYKLFGTLPTCLSIVHEQHPVLKLRWNW